MRVRSATVGVTLSLLFAAGPVQAATISIDSYVALPGETFSVDVGITDVEDLFAFVFDLSFDSSVVQLVDVREGDFLSRSGQPTLFCALVDGFCLPDATGVPSVVTVIGSILGDPPGVSTIRGETAVLAQAVFTYLGGSSPLDLSAISLSNSALNEIEFDVMGGATVTAVPEPSTLGLLCVGAAALVRRRRRRRL